MLSKNAFDMIEDINHWLYAISEIYKLSFELDRAKNKCPITIISFAE